MHVESLILRSFRTYPHLQLSLEPGITVFTGSNGVGKTNIVEAIDYAATLGSHRVSTIAPLIHHDHHGQPAVVCAVVNRHQHRTRLEYTLGQGKASTVAINRGAPTRAREGLGILRTVLFSPEDLSLIKGDPGQRRNFLDSLATSMRPMLASVRSEYDKTVRQRNALLKSARASGGLSEASTSTLAAWNEHLARYGAAIIHARIQLIAALQPEVVRAYQQLAPGPRLPQLLYQCTAVDSAAASTPSSDGSGQPGTGAGAKAGTASSSSIAELALLSVRDFYELLLEACRAEQTRELERAQTLVGPHRDELELNLGDFPARGYASHGEMWSYALSLRLGSWYLHVDDDRSPGSSPVLILDDVFAELDAARRTRLAEAVLEAEQVLVTAAVAEDVPRQLIDPHGGAGRPIHLFRVTPGQVVAEREPA